MSLECIVKLSACVAVLAVTTGLSAHAADRPGGYPAKPVRIIVPFAPGGGIDISTRLVAVKLAEFWGEAVIVENRAGAGGTIGSELAAKAVPDGHTLLAVPISHAAVGSLRKNLKYHPQSDFVPIIHLASAPNVIVVHPSIPVRSLRQLINLAQKRKGEVTYASGGRGSSTHLAAELLALQTGIELSHIPYKGGQTTMTDLLTGQVAMFIGSLPATLAHVRANRLRGLAVTSAVRLAVLPDVPPAAEAGAPGYEYLGWYGMLAPAGTRPEIINRLNADMNRALQLPEIRERFEAQGAMTVGGPPEQFEKLLASEMAKWAKAAAHAGLRPE